MIRDDTSDDGRPVEGGVRCLKVSRFLVSGDGQTSFWTYRGEFEQYLPLWNDMQALAVRGVITGIAGAEKKAVPFQRRITNDDPDELRGYRDFRWRGLGLALLTL